MAASQDSGLKRFMKTVIAGGTAGVAEICLLYPTDVIKTRQQLLKGGDGMLKVFLDLVKAEGVANLYRGMISPILAEAPKRAVKFSMNDTYKGMLKDRSGHLSSPRAAVAGALAGMTEMFVNCPFEVVKVRMQSKENLSKYSSTMDCLVQTLRAEGPLALYKGAEAQLWRNASWNGTYFGLIGTLRNSCPPPEDATKGARLFFNFWTGALGGLIATTMNTPFDVVKSRMQNQAAAEYNYVLPSLAKIFREEGFSALYKGYGPRIVRLAPGGGIMLVMFDKMMELMKGW
jgi:solute carrier family 25 2-oxodicarboxylate transporter 21